MAAGGGTGLASEALPCCSAGPHCPCWSPLPTSSVHRARAPGRTWGRLVPRMPTGSTWLTACWLTTHGPSRWPFLTGADLTTLAEGKEGAAAMPRLPFCAAQLSRGD